MNVNTIKIAIAAAALGFAPALSAADTETRTTKVTYSDLDLSTQAGLDELDRRIANAAREVCNLGEHQVGSNLPSREASRCFRDAKRQLDQHFAQARQDAQLGG